MFATACHFIGSRCSRYGAEIGRISAAAALSISRMRLTRTAFTGPRQKQFKLETDFEGMTDKGYFYSAYRYSAAEHGGTHLDSPVHFAKGRYTVDQTSAATTDGRGDCC